MKRALSFLVWIRRALEVSLILGVVIVILHSQKPVVSTASAALSLLQRSQYGSL
jgi:hypothetical protein